MSIPRGRKARILLISLPGFAHGWCPLNIARIKAFLMEKGYSVRNLSLCVDFSHHVARKHPSLVRIDKEIGEFGRSWHELYFSALFFGHRRQENLLRQSVRDMLGNRDIYNTKLDFSGNSDESPSPDQVAAESRLIQRYCDVMRQFITRRIDAVEWEEIDIVGFSCVESQFLVSLYTARQIRRKKEGKLITVFGGPMFQLYNLDALLRHFAEIDHIAIGEGEEALDEIARDFESGTRAPQVIARLAAPFSKDPVGRNHNAMDRYPPPDYDDIGKPKIKEQSIATYIGKGCHHSRCSFCAITERGLHVRPPATIFNEIQHLISRYGTTNINFGDWEINGDPKVLEELCDLLIKNKIRLQAWGELSARNVSPALLRKMKQAGISDVQIGIESFSSRLLRLMRKPAGLLDNVKVLKWGIEAEMHTMFSNIVCNHPLSHADFVEENYRVMRMIAHLLRPPVELNLNELDLYRTSELFRKADEYGISNIRDYRFYQRCYPEGSIGGRIPMFNLSFRKFPIHPLWKRIDRFLLRIRKHPVRLSIRNLKDGAKIYDSRGFNGRSYRLGGLDSHVLRQTLDQVAKPQDAAVALEVSEEVVLASLRRLVRARLVLQRGNLYLGLPLRK